MLILQTVTFPLCSFPRSCLLAFPANEPAFACPFTAEDTVQGQANQQFLVHVSAVDNPSKEEEEGEFTARETKVLPQVAQSVVDANAGVFADLPPGLPPDRGVTHTTNTGNQSPVCQQQYRLSPTEREEVQQQVQVLLDKQLIQPSRSAYSSLVVFVSKPDGSLRMCADQRALNR